MAKKKKSSKDDAVVKKTSGKNTKSLKSASSKKTLASKVSKYSTQKKSSGNKKSLGKKSKKKVVAPPSDDESESEEFSFKAINSSGDEGSDSDDGPSLPPPNSDSDSDSDEAAAAAKQALFADSDSEDDSDAEPTEKKQMFQSDDEEESDDAQELMGSDDDEEDDEYADSSEDEMDLEAASTHLEAQQRLMKMQAEAEMQTNIKSMQKFTLPSGQEIEREKIQPPELQLIYGRVQDIVFVLSDFKNQKEAGRSRTEYLTQLRDDMSNYFGYLPELVDKFLTMFSPAECLQFLEANEVPRPMTIRANTLKTRRRDLAQTLINRYVDFAICSMYWRFINNYT